MQTWPLHTWSHILPRTSVGEGIAWTISKYGDKSKVSSNTLPSNSKADCMIIFLYSLCLNMECGMTTATLTLILLLSGRVFMPNRLRRFDFKSKPFETWLQSPKRQGRKTMTNGAIFLKEIGSFRIHFFPVRKCIFLKKVKSKCKAIIMTISSLTENVRSKIILQGPNRFCRSFYVGS